ncbi:MAG: UDP-2,3-diacylglucosamine diphosphatase LpxI [Pseudomonadota bacterium]|nr:UDP-2,3-diacylglucosamine diphosphatase LpxI [Pseudomonadota bacterium]
MDSKLGILAGGGELPGRLIQICRERGRPFHVIAIEGQADPEVIGDSPQTWLRLGAAQKALEVARKEKLDEIVMVGPVRRPTIVALRPDALAARVLAKASASSVMGDDGLLKAIIRQIEDFGFKVIGPHELLEDGVNSEGTLGRCEPDDIALQDIRRGCSILTALGPADVGQSIVIQDNIVIAIEAVEGTDAMIQRSGPLHREGPGGVLVKLLKPGQEKRADLPTIGPQTVENADKAGIRGIAIHASDTLFVDREQTIALADSLGLFIFSFDPDKWLESA